jgi:hypothetical protein
MKSLATIVVTLVVLGCSAGAAVAMPIEDPITHPSPVPADPAPAPTPSDGGDALLTVLVGTGALALGAGGGFTAARAIGRAPARA